MPSPRDLRTYKKLATIAILVSIAIGVLVLLGWMFDIQAFKSINTKWISMRANTSIATLIASVALLLFIYADSIGNTFIRKLIQILGLVVLIIGGLTLSQYTLNLNLGLDQILFKEAANYTGLLPGRMSINTSAGLALLGLAIMLIPYRRRFTIWISQTLAVIVGLVALASCLLFLFSAPAIHSLQNVKMAVHTAVVLFLLSFSILACHPREGLMGLFTGAELGSIFARRLTILTILLPSGISWAVYFSIQNNWIRPFPGTSPLAFDAFLVSLLMIACFTVLIWKHANRIREIEMAERATRGQVEETEKKLQESRDQLAVALEAAQMGTWEWDLKTNELASNAQQEMLMGYGANGSSRSFEEFLDTIHPDDREGVLEEAKKSIRERVTYDKIFRVSLSDGTNRWILTRAKCYYGKANEPLKLMGVAADISLLKNNEMRLKEALQARDEFLSIASHELKTPLTSLKIQTQVVKRAIDKSDRNAYSKENIDRLVDQCDRQVSRLTRLVDDMLDIARIRSGKLTIEPEEFDLCELVKETTERMKPQFLVTASGLPKISHCERALGRWDKLRIEQVIINLLTNAIRYGQGQPIEIEIKALEGFARLAVRDYGMGIAPDNKSKIFDRFERAVSTSEVGGLGLGLFITKQIVWSHGGRIWVDSELGKGSTFYVDLPYNTVTKIVEGNEASL